MPRAESERRVSLFPSVIVGLGGTGRRVCGYLKKTFQERFGGIPPHVRLVGIDTKKAEEADDDLAALDESEKLMLRIENPPQYLDNLEVWAPWFPAGDVGRALKGHILVANDNGAGALRPIGKVMLEANWRQVHTRLQRAAEQVNRNVREFDTNGAIRAEFQRIGLANFGSNTQDILFIIIGNLVSGTGSGGFLELAYIAAAAQAERAKVFGFLTLPPLGDRREHLHNAAAALRELQHYMSPQVWNVTAKQYRVDSPAARDILMNFHTLLRRAPYDVVHVARPVDATTDAVNALSKQTADFIFDFTCTDLGAALHGEYVNFNPQVSAVGEKPIFSTYASFQAEDHSRTASRLARAMIADFIADDISGEANPGEAQCHRGWQKSLLEASMEKIRQSWSLPSADQVNALTAEEDFRKSCQVLLNRVKNEISKKQFRVGATSVSGLSTEAIRDALLRDAYLTANIHQADALLRNLSNRIAPQLEGLSRAYEEVLPEMVRTLIRELCVRLHSIYMAGGSVRQMIDVCKELRAEVESLATKISAFEYVVKQEFSFDALTRILQEYVTRKVSEWAGTGVGVFRETIRQQVAIYIEKRTSLTAIRLINGFESPTARPIVENICGVDFQLTGGLRAGIERVIGALERLQALVLAVDASLESRGSLRTTRKAAVQDTLQRIYSDSRGEVVEQLETVRRDLLADVGGLQSVFALLDIPQAEIEAAVERIAGKYVPELATEDFETWWAEHGIDFTADMLLNRSSLRFDRVRADNEGSGLKTIIALRSRASEVQQPRVRLGEIADVLVPVANDTDNSVSLMVSHGLASVSWIQGFDVLSNGYRQLGESAIAMLHTVSDPIRLRPIAIGGTEALMFYVAGCAFDWIRPLSTGALYIYGADEDTSLESVASQYAYAFQPDPDSQVGPIEGLLRRFPSVNAHPPGPEPPIRISGEGTGTVAGSVYEHLRWRLEQRVLASGPNGGHKRKRITETFKLIRLFLAWQLDTNDETYHLTPARIRTAAEHLPSWIRSVFGSFAQADEHTAVAEVRREMAAEKATVLLDRMRRALLDGTEVDAAAATPSAAKAVVGASSDLMHFFTEHQIPILDRAKIIDALNLHGLVGAIQAAQQCNLTEIQQAQMLAMLTGSK